MTPHPNVRKALALAAIATAMLACDGPSMDVSAVAENDPPSLSRAGQSAPPAAPTAAPEAPPPAVPAEADGASDDGEPPRRASSRGRAKRSRATSAERPDAPASREGAPMELKRLVVGTGVEGREPVGVAKRFRAGEIERLYAYVEVTNPAKAETSIFVTLSPPSGAASPVELDVGAQERWRTWSFTRRPKVPGTWTAVVRDEEGRVLGRTSFEVVP